LTDNLITVISALAFVALQVAFLLRAILRPHREPSSRIAWVLLILGLPGVGIIAYLLFGETSIGQARYVRHSRAVERARQAFMERQDAEDLRDVDSEHRHLFNLGHSITGFQPVSGNSAELLADSNAGIDQLVADMDAAEDTVHLLFYIWLRDRNGLKVIEAAKRAARRGVTVRVLADDLGSRKLIRSAEWREMGQAGVRTAAALPVGFLPLHPFRGRIDLRNHRKIAVIDNRVTYCGSQNCADPEFRVKAKYAPWVDILVRFEGPVALQNQALFVTDWMTHVDEDLSPLVTARVDPAEVPGITAQVIGTGPTVRFSAMPEMFEALMHAAREELVITTPYYVPSESMHSALCAAGRRGVRTTLILPARNDSWIVAAASQSYYASLVGAEVRVMEYPLGLLHTKSLTFDGSISQIGSANLDRRSFDLNYENNILMESPEMTRAIRARQQEYIDASRMVTADDIEGWSTRRRLWNNAVAMLGPVL